MRPNIPWSCLFPLLSIGLLLPCTVSAQQDQEKLSPEELVVQLAQTKLNLAEVELQCAEKMIEGPIGAYGKLYVERLRSNLSVAREQFKQANISSTGGPEQVRKRAALEKVRLAKLDLEAARKAGEAGGFDALEVTRLELRHKLAQLHVQVLENPSNYLTLVDSMQRQIDRLGEEILSLDQRISRLEADR